MTFLYGYGFPRRKGGPVHWARHMREGGLPKVVADLTALAAAHPTVPHWAPCALLVEEAAKVEGKVACHGADIEALAGGDMDHRMIRIRHTDDGGLMHVHLVDGGGGAVVAQPPCARVEARLW